MLPAPLKLRPYGAIQICLLLLLLLLLLLCLVELWQTINTAFNKCDFRVSVFYQGVQRRWLGEVGK